MKKFCWLSKSHLSELGGEYPEEDWNTEPQDDEYDEEGEDLAAFLGDNLDVLWDEHPPDDLTKKNFSKYIGKPAVKPVAVANPFQSLEPEDLEDENEEPPETAPAIEKETIKAKEKKRMKRVPKG